MLKSKALDILKTFSTEEFKRFEQFVSSPYFNTNKSVLKLVLELKKFYPDFNSDKMTEDYIYGRVYGKDKYSYSAMRNLMSGLIQLCDIVQRVVHIGQIQRFPSSVSLPPRQIPRLIFTDDKAGLKS